MCGGSAACGAGDGTPLQCFVGDVSNGFEHVRRVLRGVCLSDIWTCIRDILTGCSGKATRLGLFIIVCV